MVIMIHNLNRPRIFEKDLNRCLRPGLSMSHLISISREDWFVVVIRSIEIWLRITHNSAWICPGYRLQRFVQAIVCRDFSKLSFTEIFLHFRLQRFFFLRLLGMFNVYTLFLVQALYPEPRLQRFVQAIVCRDFFQVIVHRDFPALLFTEICSGYRLQRFEFTAFSFEMTERCQLQLLDCPHVQSLEALRVFFLSNLNNFEINTFVKYDRPGGEKFILRQTL